MDCKIVVLKTPQSGEVANSTVTQIRGRIVIGVAGAAIATRLVASMVYGVTALDPATFAIAVLVLISVALTATWLPAPRATRMDPLIALRSQ
jgi:ABC-type antimicrobial peptide transport system permease subunit